MDQADLFWCEEVLKEFARPKHRKYVALFRTPVTAEAAPTYRDIIDQPMDMSTITSKLDSNQYASADEFKSDFELIFSNCETFNASPLPISPVIEQCRQFREEFEDHWHKKNAWLKRRHPELTKSDDGNSDQEGEMEEEGRCSKRPRRSLRNDTGSSGPSPYTSASVTRPGTSLPTTPGTSTTGQSTSQDSSTPNLAPSNAAATAAPRVAPPRASVSTRASSKAAVTVPATSEPSNVQPTAPATDILSPTTIMANAVRAMVVTEVTSLLNNPEIRAVNEPTIFAQSFWESMDRNEGEGDEQVATDPNRLREWIDLTVEEVGKHPLNAIEASIATEAMKALVVVAGRHKEFLLGNLNAQFDSFMSRFGEN